MTARMYPCEYPRGQTCPYSQPLPPVASDSYILWSSAVFALLIIAVVVAICALDGGRFS